MSRDLRILESTPTPDVLPERAAPVVVIQYRRSWITVIMMPVMILVTSLAVLSHRMKADDWRGLPYYFGLTDTRATTARVDPIIPVAEPPAVAPVIVTVIPQPPPTPMPAPSLLEPPATPQPVAKPEVVEVAAAPPDQVATLPPIPTVKAEEIWDDIRRESERRQAEAQILEDSKQLQLDSQQRESHQKKLEQMRRDRIRQVNTRVTFRDAVREALAGPENQAGAIIRGLCDREGVRIGAASALSIRSGLVTTSTARRERVEQLRRQQYSEAMILNDLILLENRNRVSRTAGIRSVDDVVVRAARHLLMAPLDDAEIRLLKTAR